MHIIKTPPKKKKKDIDKKYLPSKKKYTENPQIEYLKEKKGRV